MSCICSNFKRSPVVTTPPNQDAPQRLFYPRNTTVVRTEEIKTNAFSIQTSESTNAKSRKASKYQRVLDMPRHRRRNATILPMTIHVEPASTTSTHVSPTMTFTSISSATSSPNTSRRSSGELKFHID